MQMPGFSRFRRILKKTRNSQPKYAKRSKYITYSQGGKDSAEKYLIYLSRQIIYVGDEINTALLKGINIPRKPIQWVKEATTLKCKVSDSLKEQNSKNSTLKSDELGYICEQIFDFLKHCPVEGKYDRAITFITGLHELKDEKLSYSTLLLGGDALEDQDVERKLASIDISMPTIGFSEQDDTQMVGRISFSDSYNASIPELSSENLFTLKNMWNSEISESGESSQVYDAKIQEISPEFSSPYILKTQIDEKCELEIVEEANNRLTNLSSMVGQRETSSRRSGKMLVSMCDPNGENVARLIQTDDFHFINENDSDSGIVIPISIVGEKSIHVELRFEILSASSSSREMLNLNNSFGLDPNRDNYLFSTRKSLTKLEFDNQRIPIGNHEPSGAFENFQDSGVVLPEYLIMNRSGRGSNEMPKVNEWCQAVVVNLMEKKFLLLNEEPNSPNLVLLFLQRNNRLTRIPSSFFDGMHVLHFLDLSNTRIRELPSSLFKLTKLQVLMLRSCVCLRTLPAEVKNLTNMEVLDISGTDLYDLPREVGQLSRLKHLQLSFYGPDYGRGYARLPSEMVSPSIFFELQALQELSIVVHPEDQRWNKIAGDISSHIGKLKMLCSFQFYFPTVETLNSFVEVSSSWKEHRMRKFNLIVGHNIKRFISRVPNEVELKYDQHDRCLRFINCSELPQVVNRVLEPVTALYLDHHLKIQNLSEFGISNFKELKFCVVRECPNFQVMMVNKKIDIPKGTAPCKSSEIGGDGAFPNLEHLEMHYLWELEQIWEDPMPSGSFKALKFLMVNTCRKLEYIASQSTLQCLSSLETLIIEDCESLKSIVKESENVKYEVSLLPQLTRVVLRHLPQLFTLGRGLCPSENVINIHCCPKLIMSPNLGRTKLRKLSGSSGSQTNPTSTKEGKDHGHMREETKISLWRLQSRWVWALGRRMITLF